jgi:hypothetical protein
MGFSAFVLRAGHADGTLSKDKAMPTTLPAGPYRTIPAAGGISVPYYIIPFDEQGRCLGPQTRAHLLSQVAGQAYSDIFLFSHGWNNDFPAATGRYEHFIEGFMGLRQRMNLPVPESYKPLLVGIFWPSAALTLESERGPKFASQDPRQQDPAVQEHLAAMRSIAESLPQGKEPAFYERFYTLCQQPELNETEALELAEYVLASGVQGEEDVPDNGAETAKALVEVWSAYQKQGSDDFSDFTTSPTSGGAGLPSVGPSAPQAAGFFGNIFKKLDPRPALRLATVWKMKDRAGVVGANGVGPLLRELLSHPASRVHLVGHSFGGKVVLSATCIKPLPRPVESMLLLQPAVSHLCFAENVPDANRPGGYREALFRVNRPILSTFSGDDFPLTKVFHFAVRRKADLGEARIAAAAPPSKFAALGGFGPRGCGEKIINIHSPGQPYALFPSVRVFGLQSTGTITGHGEISNDATWWALHQLIATANT